MKISSFKILNIMIFSLISNAPTVNRFFIGLSMKFINTICYPCRNKQEEVIKMAQDNDAVLVIGSHASKNTMNLYLLAQKYNSKSFLVENMDMIDFNALKGVNTIGVVSGTSSPESVINEVIDCLEHNQVR